MRLHVLAAIAVVSYVFAAFVVRPLLIDALAPWIAPEVEVRVPARSEPARLDRDKLARLMFGPPRPKSVAPTRPLRSKLHGTLVARNPELSRGLVTEPDAPHAKLLGPGDTLEDGVIVEVLARQVVVQRADQFEVLRVNAAPPSILQVPLPPPNASGAITVRRAEVFGQLEKIMQTTRIVPRFEPKPGGFQVFLTADSPLLGLGLKSGDVLMTLDGTPLTPQRAMQLFREFDRLEGGELGLRRDGQPVSLRVAVQ